MQFFTIKPIRSSGLGDQLGTQFMRLYKLGVACGLEYVYDDLYFPRSVKPNWYDRIQARHLNLRLALLNISKGRKNRVVSGINVLLMKAEASMNKRLMSRKDDLADFLNIPAIAKHKPKGNIIDINVESFIKVNPSFGINDFREFLDKVCQGTDSIPRLCWDSGMWAMIPSIDNALVGVDIPSPFAQAFSARHGDDVINKVVFHIRCGDSCTVHLPSGTDLIVYDKFLFTSEEQMKDIFAIDSHRKTILPQEYIGAFHNYNPKDVTVISDGFDLTYQNIFRNLLKWKCPVTLSRKDIKSLIAQAKKRNKVFEVFKGAKMLIGESETLLKESIIAISNAETLIWGVGGFAMNVKGLFGKSHNYVCNIKDY